MRYNVYAGKMVLITGMLALAGCQRPPGDGSAVPYRIVEDRAQGGACTLCVAPLPDVPCAEGQAAEVRWTLPAANAAQRVDVQIVRKGGAREALAHERRSGQVPLYSALQPGDRILIQNADTGKDLFFTRITKPVGCAAQS
mgnify:CR=1 FL=1